MGLSPAVPRTSHAPWAILAGLLVAGWWAFSNPLGQLGIGPVQNAGLGFVLGVTMYGVVMVLYHA